MPSADPGEQGGDTIDPDTGEFTGGTGSFGNDSPRSLDDAGDTAEQAEDQFGSGGDRFDDDFNLDPTTGGSEPSPTGGGGDDDSGVPSFDGRQTTIRGPDAPGNETDQPQVIVEDRAGQTGQPARDPTDDAFLPDQRSDAQTLQSEFSEQELDQAFGTGDERTVAGAPLPDEPPAPDQPTGGGSPDRLDEFVPPTRPAPGTLDEPGSAEAAADLRADERVPTQEAFVGGDSLRDPTLARRARERSRAGVVAGLDVLAGSTDEAVGRAVDAASEGDVAGVFDAAAGSTDEAVGRGDPLGPVDDAAGAAVGGGFALAEAAPGAALDQNRRQAATGAEVARTAASGDLVEAATVPFDRATARVREAEADERTREALTTGGLLSESDERTLREAGDRLREDVRGGFEAVNPTADEDLRASQAESVETVAGALDPFGAAATGEQIVEGATGATSEIDAGRGEAVAETIRATARDQAAQTSRRIQADPGGAASSGAAAALLNVGALRAARGGASLRAELDPRVTPLGDFRGFLRDERGQIDMTRDRDADRDAEAAQTADQDDADQAVLDLDAAVESDASDEVSLALGRQADADADGGAISIDAEDTRQTVDVEPQRDTLAAGVVAGPVTAAQQATRQATAQTAVEAALGATSATQAQRQQQATTTADSLAVGVAQQQAQQQGQAQDTAVIGAQAQETALDQALAQADLQADATRQAQRQAVRPLDLDREPLLERDVDRDRTPLFDRDVPPRSERLADDDDTGSDDPVGVFTDRFSNPVTSPDQFLDQAFGGDDDRRGQFDELL